MPSESLVNEFKKSGKLEKPVWQALLFRILGMALIFVLQIVLARLMGPKSYGDYTVIITVINLLLVVSLFGFDSSVLRFVPSAISKGDSASVNGFVKFSSRTIMLFASLCSVAIFIFLLAKAKQFQSSFNEGIFWGMLLLPLLAFTNQASALLRSIRMIKLSLMPTYFIFPILMAISSWLYFHSYHKLTVDAAMLINLGISLVICIYISRKSRKIVKQVVDPAEPTYAKKLWLSVSAMLFLTTALNLLLRQSDILMVSYFLDNTKAGIYSVAVKVATFAALGLSVADYVIMPKISALYEAKQYSKLQKMVRNASFQILSISLPIIFCIVILGKFMLGFFGKIYVDAYWPMVILLSGQLINAFTGMVGGLLMMTGHQRTFFLFYAIAIMIQFVLNIILIKSLGINGAAIGSSIALIFLNVSAYLYVRKRLRIKASIF